MVKHDKALVGFPFTLSRVPGRGRSGGRVWDGGLSKVLRRETFAEREQREKEGWEKRLAQREKMMKEEKERNDELVSKFEVYLKFLEVLPVCATI